MNQDTYQSYLATKQASNQAYRSILHEIATIARKAKTLLTEHPDHERIADWIEHTMGFDGSFDRYHIFQYSRDERTLDWSESDDGFVFTTQETFGEHWHHHYAIPAAWVFADGAERTTLIQSELDAIAAQAKAHDAVQDTEREQADRAQYERLKERFGA